MPQAVNSTEKTAFLAKAINRLGSVYLRFVPNALLLEFDYLHEKAIKETGLTDFGDPHYQEGLHVLLDDYKKNVQPTFIGKLGFQMVLLRQLSNRLRFVEYRKKHPEVFQQALKAPLLITGIPRSGTTFLHRLINEDISWRSLKMYETLHPIPPEKGQQDNRLTECQRELKLVSWLSPELDSKHLLQAELPEECMWLMGITFTSLEYLLEKPLYKYLEWYMQHDRSQAYREYAQLLQIAQAQAPDKPLLLKAPAHRGSLDFLFEALPNLQLVITERDRRQSISSYCSLAYTTIRNNVVSLDKKKLGAAAVRRFAREERFTQNFLARHPELDCRIQYEQIRQDPLKVVRRIYQYYDIELTEHAEEKMKAYVLTHPQHLHGVHRYSAGDFGIDREKTKAPNDTKTR